METIKTRKKKETNFVKQKDENCGLRVRSSGLDERIEVHFAPKASPMALLFWLVWFSSSGLMY